MTILDPAYTELDEANAAWANIYALLKQAQYDTKSSRQAIDGVSVDMLNDRALLVYELFLGIRPSSDGDVSALVISSRYSEIKTQINAFMSHAHAALNQMRSNWRDNVVIKDANDNFNLHFFVEESNTANLNIASNFTAMNAALNLLLGHVALFLPICKAKGIVDLSSRSSALAEVVRETEAFRNEVKKFAKAAEQSTTSASEKEKAILNIHAQAEAVYSKLQAIQQQTEKESANVIALITQIKTTGANADTLEQQITGYQSKYDAFQTQLDSKLKLFADFETFTKQAEKNNQDREGEIDRLTQKADTMIRGATTAGLSMSLEEARAAYSKRMFWAQKGFFVSIFFLTMSSLPLAAHFLPGLFGDLVPAVSENAQNSSVGVIGKILLLLPATWLTVFFSKSYSEFFHLEREYAHKAALAKSVEGFKREAPKYEEEITGSVFGEILSNPSKGKSPEPANHPLYEVLTKRLFEWFGKKDQ